MGLADIRANSLKPETRVTVVTLYNISVVGMMCAPGINVETGNPLVIYIYEFMGKPADIRLTGRVVWLANGISDYMEISFNEDEIKPETNLQDELEIDLIKAIEITVSLEQKYKISIRNEDMPNIRTVRQVVDTVNNLVSAKAED